MLNYRVQLFGLPQIFINGQAVQIRRRKAFALLIYLLVKQSPATRVYLTTLLWNSETASKTNAYLRLLIHDLKQALGKELILADEISVTLASNLPIRVDTKHFSSLVHQSPPTGLRARIAILNEALELYKDGFLAGFTLPDAPAFEAWQGLQTERFQELFVQAHQELVEAYLALGDLIKGIEIAQQWFAYDPLSEAAYVALMQLHYRAGRRSVALRYYERLCAMLEHEFDLLPMPRTQALYNLIRRAENLQYQTHGILDNLLVRQINQVDFSLSRYELLSDEQLHHLYEIYPDLQSIHIEITKEKAEIRLQTSVEMVANGDSILLSSSPFVGRERELAEVRQLIRMPENRLITILGLGGVGKTRLVQELSISEAAFFGEAFHFVALEHAQSEDDIFYSIAEVLVLDVPQRRDAARQMVLDVLKERQHLLILDNFEHLIAYKEIIELCFQSAPHLTILVTSRERLNIESEIVYPLQGLNYPDKVEHQSLGDYESVRLFVERLQHVRPMKAVSDTELPDIAIICRLVQGVPLAIVIAAAWGELLHVVEIRQEVQQSLDFLQARQHDIPIRQRSIRAVFDTSWNLLTEAERDILLRLSVFRGGFSQQAAASVCNASLHTLTFIANKSLLLRDEISGQYSLHPLLHQFVESRLAEHEGEYLIRHAHSSYYLGLVREFDGYNVQNEQDMMLSAISAELENIRAAWNFAVQSRDFEAIDEAIGVMSHYHAIRGLWSEGFNLFETARQILAPGKDEKPHPTWGRLLAHHYGIAQHYGGVDQRLAHLHRGLTIVQEAGLEFATAHALSEIAVAYILAERYSEAIPFIQQVVDYHEQENLEHSVAYSYWYLALCYALIGRYDEAQEYNEKSYRLKQQFGDHRGMSDCLNMSASLAFAQGNFLQMAQFLEKARSVSQNINNRFGLMFSSLALGFYHLLVGNSSEARQLAFEALKIANELPNVEGQTAGQALLGVLAHLRGETIAKDYMQAAWSILQEQPSERSTESVNLGMVFFTNWALAVLGLSYEDATISYACIAEIIKFALRTQSFGSLMICLPIMAVYLSSQSDEQFRNFLSWNNSVTEIGTWSENWSVLQTLNSDNHLKSEPLTVDLLVDALETVEQHFAQEYN